MALAQPGTQRRPVLQPTPPPPRAGPTSSPWSVGTQHGHTKDRRTLSPPRGRGLAPLRTGAHAVPTEGPGTCPTEDREHAVPTEGPGTCPTEDGEHAVPTEGPGTCPTEDGDAQASAESQQRAGLGRE